MGMQLTVTLGEILQIAGTVIVGVSVYVALRERLVRIETQIGPIWQWWNTRIERREVDERRG
jgi:hypothetical protein